MMAVLPESSSSPGDDENYNDDNKDGPNRTPCRRPIIFTFIILVRTFASTANLSMYLLIIIFSALFVCFVFFFFPQCHRGCMSYWWQWKYNFTADPREREREGMNEVRWKFQNGVLEERDRTITSGVSNQISLHRFNWHCDISKD